MTWIAICTMIKPWLKFCLNRYVNTLQSINIPRTFAHPRCEVASCCYVSQLYVINTPTLNLAIDIEITLKLQCIRS